MNVKILFIGLLTLLSASFGICNEFSFEYDKISFSLCSKKSLEIIEAENMKFFCFSNKIYVVGTLDNLKTFFQKSGFKLDKGNISDTRSSCVYIQKKMIATNFDYIEDLNFSDVPGIKKNIPNEVLYNEKEIVFTIYKSGEENGIKKGSRKKIRFK
ncbi:MAG: hypothetical protein HUK21_02120 [Fibrobacteraceae bacterium]|nr:hypothetical protein [Fibrobacteraceae bacterium]